MFERAPLRRGPLGGVAGERGVVVGPEVACDLAAAQDGPEEVLGRATNAAPYPEPTPRAGMGMVYANDGCSGPSGDQARAVALRPCHGVLVEQELVRPGRVEADRALRADDLEPERVRHTGRDPAHRDLGGAAAGQLDYAAAT